MYRYVFRSINCLPIAITYEHENQSNGTMKQMLNSVHKVANKEKNYFYLYDNCF